MLLLLAVVGAFGAFVLFLVWKIGRQVGVAEPAVATLVASVAVPPVVASSPSARGPEAGAPGPSSSGVPGRLRRPNDVFRKPGF